MPPSPFLIYGPHGYRTFPHSRCQGVPTAEGVNVADIEGDWSLVEYHTSFGGKPFPPHSPYLCPESRVVITPDGAAKMNVSQLSIEWPVIHRDVVEWVQHPRKEGVFFHEENIFSLWTMKVMEVVPDDFMILFFCIDYTIWPGWNHRGVFVLSRNPTLKTKVKRKLSVEARRRMRIDFSRDVNTTVCEPDDFLGRSVERWHPHRKINRSSIRAPVHPWVSRKHRRNLKVLH